MHFCVYPFPPGFVVIHFPPFCVLRSTVAAFLNKEWEGSDSLATFHKKETDTDDAVFSFCRALLGSSVF